jgi:hypothetical protein
MDPAEIDFEPDTLEGSDDIMNAIDSADNGAQNQGANGADTAHAGDGTTTNGLSDTEGGSDILGGLDTPKKDAPAKGAKPEDQANKGTQQDPKDKDYPAEIKGEKARKHFDTLKSQKDEAVKRATDLDARLKTLEQENQKLKTTGGINAPEVQALNKEVADLKKQIEEKDKVLAYKAVEELPAFIEGVKQPIQKAENIITQLVSHYDLNESLIDKAIQEPNEFKRDELLRQVMQEVPMDHATARTKLSDAVTSYVDAIAKERELRENAKGNRDLVERETKESEVKKNIERLRSYEEASKGVEATLRDKVPELFEKDDAGTEGIWSKIQAEAGKVKDFDAMHPRGKMFANVASHAFVPMVTMIRDLKGKLAESEKAYKDLQGSLPGAGAGNTPGGDFNSSGGDDEDPTQEKNLLSML